MRSPRADESLASERPAEERNDTRGLDVLIVAGNARSLIANRGDLIREMKDRGLRVGALVPRADYLPETGDLGIPVFLHDMRRTGMNPFSDLRALLQLAVLIRHARPRIVFAYTMKPVVYGTLAARLVGVKRSFAMITGLGHAYTTQTPKTRAIRALTDRLYRAAMRRCEKVFFQNPDDLEEFLARGILGDPSKAVVVDGSGVNLARFPRRRLPEGTMHFLFVGRLLSEKGIAEFVEAAIEVRSRWPECWFTAVGGHDPSLPHAVSSKQLETWKGSSPVVFVGALKDVRPWLERCTVFVLPSYREGTPRSSLEAMATGRAVVTTDVPGCRETVIDGENGYLVAPRDSGALAKAMERYLEAPSLAQAHADASYRRARDKYDVRLVNAAILDAMGIAS